MKAYEYRDGDIVEVSPGWRDGYLISPFKGVVDSRSIGFVRKGLSRSDWVWVRQTEPAPRNFSGGWYACQCRLLFRPPQEPALPVPGNIHLSNN